MFVWRYAILFYSYKFSESKLYIRIIKPHPTENIQCAGKKLWKHFKQKKNWNLIQGSE